MQFTEAQQQDVMLLRRLFYGKLGVLARERKECLKRMPYAAATTEHEVSDRLSEVVNIAQELVDITAAERQTRLQFTSAYCRGVRLCCACACLPTPSHTCLTVSHSFFAHSMHLTCHCSYTHCEYAFPTMTGSYKLY